MNHILSAIQRDDNLQRLALVEKEFNEFIAENLNHDNAILSYPILNQLMYLYDSHYFDKYLVKNSVIALDISRRMTRAAGLTRYNRKTKHFEIVFSVPLLLHTFNENKGKSFDVNGISCNSPAQALMRVMEHELVHVLEFILKGNSSCSKQDFRIMAYRLFGHTQTKHAISAQLLDPIKKSEFKYGQKVTFEYEKVIYKGFVNRITKRATVLVKSAKGNVIGKDGNRYAKYYVPLTLLKKID